MNKSLIFYLRLFGDFNPSDLFTEEELQFISAQLSRKEEIQSGLKDQWGNWDIQFSKNEVDKPFLDQLVLNRLREKGIPQKSIWPGNRKFAVCLTHDVDRVESYSPESFKRNLRKRLNHATSMKEKFVLSMNLLKTSLKSLLTRKHSDPLWHYEDWVKLETAYGFSSTYFFYVRPEEKDVNVYDCDYTLNDPMIYDGKKLSVSDYIKILSVSGFEIGLHGSYLTWNSTELFAKQCQRLEESIQKPVTVTRQHYLHYDITQTPEVHIANGIEVDSTIGFNTGTGFRAGTCFPFLIESGNNYLLEVPLILMDSSFLFNENITLEEAKVTVDHLVKKVEEVGGCLTINFHPDYLNDALFFDTYKYILKQISVKDCCVLNLSDIKDIFTKCVV